MENRSSLLVFGIEDLGHTMRAGATALAHELNGGREARRCPAVAASCRYRITEPQL